MHVIKGIAKHIFYLVKGKRYPKGSSEREALLLQATTEKLDNFRFSAQQTASDDRFRSIRGPPGFLARSKPPFLRTGVCVFLDFCSVALLFFSNSGKVSAHDWQNVVEFAAPVLLWDLPDSLYFLTMDVLDCLKQVCARRLVVGALSDLRRRVIETW